MVQKQKKNGWRLARIIMAVLVGLLLLAIGLPSTGGILAGPAHDGMWRYGPFLFFPGPFFTLVGVVTLSTGCVLFGIVRENAFEKVGWVLFGILVLFALMR
jgi:hypothetical protein